MTEWADAVDDLLDPENKVRQLVQPGMMLGVADVDEDPEAAARAIQLGKATGVPAPVIHGDLEGFEQGHKARLVGEMIAQHPDLQRYVTEYPMGSKVSNDDYPSLIDIGESLKKISPIDIVGAAVKGAKEGWGDEDVLPTAEEYSKAHDFFGRDALGAGHIAADLAYVSRAGLDIFSRAFRAAIHGAAKGGARALQQDPILSALVQGQGEYSTERDIGGFLEWLTSWPHVPAVPGGPKAPTKLQPVAPPEIVSSLGKISPYIAAGEVPPPGVDTWIDGIKKLQADEGLKALKETQSAIRGSKTFERSPDAGEAFLKQSLGDRTIGISADAVAELYGMVDPVEATKPIIAKLRQLEDESQKLVVEKDNIVEKFGVESPEATAAFDTIDQNRAQRSELNAEFQEVANKKTKKVGPDDGLLGWVPDLEGQLARAQATGGDVIVPLSGWLSRMDPAVAKQLEEHLRLTPEGITKFEGTAKEPKSVEGAPPPKEVRSLDDLVRKEGGYEPLAQVGDRGIRLEPAKEELKTDVDRLVASFSEDERPGARLYHISDNGKQVGSVWLRQLPERPDIVRIEDIYSMAEGGQGAPNTIGLHAVQGLMDEIRSLYPNATKVAGYRVSGARERASFEQGRQRTGWVEVPLKAGPKALAQALGWDMAETSVPKEPVPSSTMREAVTSRVEVEFRPRELYTQHEADLSAAVDQIIEQMAPKAAKAAVDRVEIAGQMVRAVYQPAGAYEPTSGQPYVKPLIFVAMRPQAPTATLASAVHEVMHHLRDGLWTSQEWATLERAAERNGWIEKHSIETRYKDAPDWLKREEAIAEEFASWFQGKLVFGKGLPQEVTDLFQRLKDLLEAVASRVKEIFGQPVGFEQLFEKAASGEVGAREQTRTGMNRFARAQEFAMATEEEGKALFERAKAIGMTEDQFRRYMKKIDERRQEDLARAERRNERAAKVTKTEQWKQALPEVRAEVEAKINVRPDIMADDFFRQGIFNGEKMDQRVRIGEEYLSEAQKAVMDPSTYSKSGVNPNDIAGVFGYFSGEEMVNAITALQTTRRDLGLSHNGYKAKLIREQTEATMMRRYGVPEHDTLLKEIREDVVSETQMDLLHEEVMALATKSGAEAPIHKNELKAWVRDSFANTRAADVSMEAFLRESGKAGREAELALLKDKPTDAFKWKQRQYIATLFAAEAKGFAKEQARFEKLADKFEKREVKNVDPIFTDFAQSLLSAVGLAVRRSPFELAEGIRKSGFTSFDQFVQSTFADGWEISMPDWMQSGQFKPHKDLTVAEWRDFHSAIAQLDHIGREIRQIEVMGEKMDFADFKTEVLGNIRSLPVQPKKPSWLRKSIQGFDSVLVRMEEVAKDLDLREESGPLYNALIHPMMDAKHTEYKMFEALVEKLKQVKEDFGRDWQKTLNDPIDQTFFIDPYDGAPFDLTRQNLIQIMLNWGTRSSIDKFTKGYVGKDLAPAFEQQMKALIDQHATQRDWDYVRRIWSLFEDWRKDADNMYYDLSGVAPKWLEPATIDTPFGQIEGGYYPVIYDKLRSNINMIEEGGGGINRLFSGDYFRATTANHYTKERTGYVAPIQIDGSIELVASRMQQMMHDIAYRRAVINVSKVIHDKDIRAAVRKHYGPEYEAQLDPWVKDIANHFNQDERALGIINNFLRRLRYNLVAHALGFNLKVILSPDIGMLSPSSFGRMFGEHADTIASKSKELPHTFKNIDRDFRESLEHIIQENKWNNYQSAAVKASFAPVVLVSQNFRKATFVKAYDDGIARGLSEGEAISQADSLVRERHGSAGLPDMPKIMRSNEALKMATMFYGFFNTMYNWQRQIPGQVRRGDYSNAVKTLYGSVLLPAVFGAILFNKQDPNESWFKFIAKALALQPLTTLPFARDFANYLIEGNRPSAPYVALIQSIGALTTDIKNVSQGKKVEKPISHVANVVGLGLGLPMAQIGRTAQFASDVYYRKQQPRNIMEWFNGIVKGQIHEKKGGR